MNQNSSSKPSILVYKQTHKQVQTHYRGDPVPVVVVNVHLCQMTYHLTSELVCLGNQALLYVMAFQVYHFKQNYIIQGKNFPCNGRESLNLLQQKLFVCL